METAYRVAGGETDINSEVLFRSATLRMNCKSAVCLLSALEFYHLTDLISKKVWLMVDQQNRTAKSDIRVFRTANPYWDTGIRKEKAFHTKIKAATRDSSKTKLRSLSRDIPLLKTEKGSCLNYKQPCPMKQ